VRGEPVGHGFRHRREAGVGSTNDVAKAFAESGEPEGLLVTATEQSGGRGRHGRVWQSPPGNFYGSLILRPEGSLAAASTLSLVIGIAVADAVRSLSADVIAPRLKWPNDVQVEGRKLAGILLEGAASPDGSCAWVVAGLGVNLVAHPAIPGRPSTALAEHGLVVSVHSFLEAYLEALAALLPAWRAEGFAAHRAAWLAHAEGIGSEVGLRVGSETCRGRFRDLGVDGSLVLETAAGASRRFTTGELFFASAASPLAAAASAR
jgi:BirA family biotin operon repressor/biotin-[acetyl-CoA-carboxylase] ligase